tara:strand:- start:106 stop:825 length:720 start_codon:yes stop_codon:yes gene_type:complete
MIGFGQQTYVPDDNFEQALINLGYDNVLDDSVLTANINTIDSLTIGGLNISDLTGIEDFTYLTVLYCVDNQLTNLDVTQNNALNILFCSFNNLIGLDVSQNPLLTTLFCDINQITSLDLSNNLQLYQLVCQNNQLTSLDLRNGNNTNFIYCSANNNSNLFCINVDDPAYSNANWPLGNNFDPQQYFSNNCPPSAIQEHTINKELLKVTDLLGRETKPQANTPFIEIYDDGTVEKRIVIE